MLATRRTTVLLLALAAGATTAACDGSTSQKGGELGGTIVVATPDAPRTLFPIFFGSSTEKMLDDLLFDHLAEIGPDMNTVGDRDFQPRLARSWSWSPDSLSIAFRLDSTARWHDGVPVRASDVRFTWQVASDPTVQTEMAPLIARIDSVTARDSLTAVVWFHQRYPQQFFDAVYHLHIVPAHLLDSVPRKDLRTIAFNRAPVGSGRFRLARWEEGSRVELVADTTNWRGRPRIDRLIFSITPDLNSMFTRVFAGEADVAEPVLNPTLLAEAPKHRDLALKSTPGSDYAFVQFNLRDPRDVTKPHPLFASRALRLALAHALDRRTLVKAVFDTLAVPSTGPMTRWQPLADTTVSLPDYDPARAKALLDSLGWRDVKGAGVRERDGVPLRIALMIPNTSRVRQQFAVLMQDALRQVGVETRIEEVDFGTFRDRLTRGNFDVTINALHTDPSPTSLAQTWTSAGSRLKGGQNFGLYESRDFDQAVDSALAQLDHQKARAYFRRAYQTIADDIPAIWLYEPRWNGFVHRRIRTTGMRPDAWWAGLADWSIPADERIARDRVPLAAGATP